jgi:hypothetical protein
MFNNDHLSGEEAKEHIKQLIQDAETDRLLNRLGYKSYATIRWIFALIIIAALVVGLLH